jgi:small conductance mechanosensitive channel
MEDFLAMIRVERILPALAVLLVGILLSRIFLKLFDKALQKSKLNSSMFSFLKTLMRVLLYSLAILIAAGCLGIDVSSLIAVLGVVSLAISLSVQNALSNVVGGFSLLTTQPFQVGDHVQIGSDTGIVEEISMSYTRLLTFDGITIYIPNSDAASARICNYTVAGRRRVELAFTASYDDDIEKVKAAILQAASHPKLLSDPAPVVILSAYLDSAIEYQFLGWTATENYLEVRNHVNGSVKKEFDRQGISIPYPQVDVHVQK